MPDLELWIALVLAPSASIVVASFLPITVERLRSSAVVGAIATLAVALVSVAAGATSSSWLPAWIAGSDGGQLLRMNAIARPLVPFAAILWLLTVAVTPRGMLDRGGLRRTAAATCVTLATFTTESGPVLVVLWTLSIALFLGGLSAPEHRRARRVTAVYLGASVPLLAAGVVLLRTAAPAGSALGVGLVLVAVAIRKGIVPFHAWLPDVFDRGRLGPCILFSAPQIGAYVALVLVPRGADGAAAMEVLAMLSLGTAVYAAAVSLVQREARRACGYLFVSQSALVLAGLEGSSEEALAGALCLWLSSGVAFAALGRCVLVLEARRGRLGLDRFHGGYEQMPLLAVTFLVTALACVGFPGTFGFVGQEMLLQGAVDEFPLLGFAVATSSGLNAVAVMRMYFSLFCGRSDTSPHLSLTQRERLTFGALVIVLIGLGLAPWLIADARVATAVEILAHH